MIIINRKHNEDLKVWEVKLAIVNQQCLVYKFQCNLCDAGYVGYTLSDLHKHVDGHKQKSSICKHYFSAHNLNIPPCFLEQFQVLTKCSNKFDCLVNEMLFIRKLKPSLDMQMDSIRAKIFTWSILFWSFVIMLIFRDYRNQIFSTLTHFVLRMVSWWCRNVGIHRKCLLVYVSRNHFWSIIIIMSSLDAR